MAVRTTDLQGVSKILVKVGPLVLLFTFLIVSTTYISTTHSSSGDKRLHEGLSPPKEKRDIRHNPRDVGQDDGVPVVSTKITVHPSSGAHTNWSSLLLVTMGRSGSSFTSAIISHHEEVFYASEPLHAVGKDIYNEVISPETTKKAQDVVDAFLTCDFRKMDANLFRSELFLNSKSTEIIYNCLQNHKKSAYDYVSCFIAMMRQCSERRLHFVKTIRYRLEWVREAMQRNPGLKVLYLVRDFRATLYSQAAAFETFNMTTDGEKRAKVMCATMESEAKELKVLARRFPGRIQLIRYEDGCVRPLDYARSIYTFAGLRFGQATEMYIKGITRSKKSQKVVSDKFKVERSDAIQTMNKWRRSATFEFVQKMDVFCGAADEIFGYKPARTISQLKTMQFSLVKNPKLPKGLYQPLLIT